MKNQINLISNEIGVNMQNQVNLLPEEIPKRWYNILPDLAKHLEPLPPPKGEQAKKLPEMMIGTCLEQEFSDQTWINIPKELLEIYRKAGRPRPLFRAIGLEKKLKTPAKLFYKSEFFSPTGSHKVNTALAQAYYAKKCGFKRLTTETGAGQWGTALSYACALTDLKCTVYWVRAVHDWKHERRTFMKMLGAEVYATSRFPINSDIRGARGFSKRFRGCIQFRVCTQSCTHASIYNWIRNPKAIREDRYVSRHHDFLSWGW